MRAIAAIAVVCGALAAYFAFDAARARRDLSRATSDRDAVVGREAELARKVAETSARADRVERELALLQAERDRLSGELARSASAGRRVVTLDLGAERSGKAGPIPSVRAGGEIELIRLLVPLSTSGASSARAAIRSASGARVWEGTASPAGRDAVALFLPSRLLATGDYVLTVGEGEGSRDYAFRVHR